MNTHALPPIGRRAVRNLRAWWLLAPALWLMTASGSALAAAGKAPNVIIMIADQLRFQSCGFSDPRAMTPNIDRLAREGMLFRNFVASTPVCSAFRASLLTGKYASSTGVVVNELRVNPNQDTFAHVLKAAGSRTDFIGKWHIWAHQAGGHAGADHNFVPPGPYRLGFDDFWAVYNFGHDNFHYSYWTDSPQELHGKEFKPVHFTNLAIERIKRHAQANEPFAMVLGYSPPHDPWGRNNVPKEWYDKFAATEFPLPETWQDVPDPYMDRNTNKAAWLANWKPRLPDMMRVYYAQTAALDEQVGRLLAALKETGQEDNTIVIFVSDHGEMFGAHGRVFKMTFYEESARVPFVIRWPGRVPAGAVSDACMATPDIMPTVLGLCGQKIPAAVEGMDLSHLALGRAGPEPEFALLQGMGHTYLWNDGFEWRAIRDKQYTYARYLRNGRELLFDNAHDPLQKTDLAAEAAHADKLAELRRKMNDKMAAIHDEFKPCSWYRDHWTDDRVIMRSGPGEFKRELGPTIQVDTTYGSIPQARDTVR
jgi:arylsulfatase A-like enzyme